MSAVGALARGVRLAWRLEQGVGQGIAALGAGLARGMRPAEQQALTLALYAFAAEKGSESGGLPRLSAAKTARSKAVAGAALRPLFPWEIEWFDALLPPPPARILVAGAGAGAEVVALRARGYAVAATEPVERLARQCAEVGARPVWPLDHEALGTLAGERFDAVLLGWGSLTHVLTPAGRQRTLEAAAALTSGPILASFWTQASAGPPPSGRLVAWAERAGSAVGRVRGHPPPSGLRFFAWCGFGCTLERAELEGLAQALGRRLVWWDAPYPHAAWLDPDSPPLLPAAPCG